MRHDQMSKEQYRNSDGVVLPGNAYPRAFDALKPGLLLKNCWTGAMRHRNPRYVLDRIKHMRWEQSHPGCPNLSPDSVRLLRSMLKPSDRGVEFGSGISTVWFAQRVSHLISVESDARWHSVVSELLEKRGLRNVDLLLAPADQPSELGCESQYVRAAADLPDRSIDFALVDGIYRDHAAQLLLSKIKPGGLLVIDDVHWFIPSVTRTPYGRTPAAGADGPVWSKVADELTNWRMIWTTSGINDTAIFVKR